MQSLKKNGELAAMDAPLDAKQDETPSTARKKMSHPKKKRDEQGEDHWGGG